MRQFCFKSLLSAVLLICSISLSAQDVASFLTRQMQAYPLSRLTDIYKSCFQDYMGAEHLVADRERVKVYLDEELQQVDSEQLMDWYYEPCGIGGRYVRVSIKTIIDGLIGEEKLLDVFIRSANAMERPTVESWKGEWHRILSTIEQSGLALPDYEQDRNFIESILSQGKYAISHSPEYREAYHPHYRIVERSIFENEIKPLIENKNN